MNECLFCNFVSGKIDVKKVYEDNLMIIIRDIEPKAKNHFLMIPKEHFPLLENMTEAQSVNLSKCILELRELKKELELDDGFRLVINQGEAGGQTIQHLHVHILSGEKLSWEKNGK